MDKAGLSVVLFTAAIFMQDVAERHRGNGDVKTIAGLVRSQDMHPAQNTFVFSNKQKARVSNSPIFL